MALISEDLETNHKSVLSFSTFTMLTLQLIASYIKPLKAVSIETQSILTPLDNCVVNENDNIHRKTGEGSYIGANTLL